MEDKSNRSLLQGLADGVTGIFKKDKDTQRENDPPHNPEHHHHAGGKEVEFSTAGAPLPIAEPNPQSNDGAVKLGTVQRPSDTTHEVDASAVEFKGAAIGGPQTMHITSGPQPQDDEPAEQVLAPFSDSTDDIANRNQADPLDSPVAPDERAPALGQGSEDAMSTPGMTEAISIPASTSELQGNAAPLNPPLNPPTRDGGAGPPPHHDTPDREASLNTPAQPQSKVSQESVVTPVNNSSGHQGTAKSAIQSGDAIVEVLSRVTKLEDDVANLKSQLKQVVEPGLPVTSHNAVAGKEAPGLEDGPGSTAASLPGPQIEQASFELKPLIEAAHREEQSGVSTDRAELQLNLQDAQRWAARSKALLEGIETSVRECNDIMAQSVTFAAAWPPELIGKMQGRQQGLDIISKMLNRLLQHPSAPAGDAIAEVPLPALEQAGWLDFLRDVQDEETGREQMGQRLKRASIERYQIISQVRNQAEANKKRFLSFLEKQLLPILDGLDEGLAYSEAVVQAAKLEFPASASSLNAWLETYNAMRGELLKVLTPIGVLPMDKNIGETVDYERHEPFDVEPDATLPNESIKALVRKGYEYREVGSPPRVLRAAQVIVVKN